MGSVHLGEGIRLFDEVPKKKKKKPTYTKHHKKNNTYKKTKKNKKKTKKKPSTPEDKFKIKKFNKWFKYAFGFNTSLANWNREHDTTREYLKATIIISPIKYFFFSATFNKTINSHTNQYYEPDFFYSFGYSNWHQDTFGLVYSNYSNNKFNPSQKQDRFNFYAGSWDLSYKTKFKDIYLYGDIKYIHKTKKGFAYIKASKKVKKYMLSAKYKRYSHINQNQFTLSARGYLYKKFYFSGSLYLYSHLDKETFLEPDYAYSFGWKDTRKGKISVMYSNYYTPTRFNWKEDDGPTFDRGSLSFSVNF